MLPPNLFKNLLKHVQEKISYQDITGANGLQESAPIDTKTKLGSIRVYPKLIVASIQGNKTVKMNPNKFVFCLKLQIRKAKINMVTTVELYSNNF